MKRNPTGVQTGSSSRSSSKVSSKNSSQTKGILKSSDESRIKRRQKKTTTFDENNIATTYHPMYKNYGHDKIEEPPTPFHRSPERGRYSSPIDAEVLSQKLSRLVPPDRPGGRSQSDDGENSENNFHRKVKEHYKNMGGRSFDKD